MVTMVVVMVNTRTRVLRSKSARRSLRFCYRKSVFSHYSMIRLSHQDLQHPQPTPSVLTRAWAVYYRLGVLGVQLILMGVVVKTCCDSSTTTDR